MKECMNCGGPVADDDKRCTTCGLDRGLVIYGERPWSDEDDDRNTDDDDLDEDRECSMCGRALSEDERGDLCTSCEDEEMEEWG
ncbi:MAG: hypothetical protein EBX39_04460 [Actinobacteria bacterium]|nr:hypothetical protein [Actinomycetota bacterium]